MVIFSVDAGRIMKKEQRKRLKQSIIYWIVVVLLAGSIFGPLLISMRKWPDWVKIVVISVVVVAAITGQILLIVNAKKEKPLR